MGNPTDPMERFIRLVEKTNGHWIWHGSRLGSNRNHQYGGFRASTKQSDNKAYAHRWIYERVVGPIPDGYEVDHVCRIKLCVNPAHLEAVTSEENHRRKRLDVCRSGRHDLTVIENCNWDGQGRRRGCRLCHHEKARLRRSRLSGKTEAAKQQERG